MTASGPGIIFLRVKSEKRLLTFSDVQNCKILCAWFDV